MDLQPFFDAPPMIQIHAVSALEALLLGPFVLFRRRRDRLHRLLGYVWVTNMAVAILSSMFIFTIRVVGPFSPIHLLSLAAVFGLWRAVAHARRGEIAAHGSAMRSLYFGAAGVAGLLAFLPGRMSNRMLFPESEVTGFLTLAGLAAAGAAGWFLRRRIPALRRRADGTGA